MLLNLTLSPCAARTWW